jgi:hypothetical protein
MLRPFFVALLVISLSTMSTSENEPTQEIEDFDTAIDNSLKEKEKCYAEAYDEEYENYPEEIDCPEISDVTVTGVSTTRRTRSTTTRRFGRPTRRSTTRRFTRRSSRIRPTRTRPSYAGIFL